MLRTRLAALVLVAPKVLQRELANDVRESCMVNASHPTSSCHELILCQQICYVIIIVVNTDVIVVYAAVLIIAF